MISWLAGLARPWLNCLDPETAHRAAILALKLAVAFPTFGRAVDER
jgi:hypothetical protein